MPQLSPRQQQALQYLASGKTISQAALLMGIKITTFRYHIWQAKIKLNAPNLPNAIAVAVTLELVVIPITFEKMNN